MTNRDRVIELYKAYSARDAKAIAGLLHDDVVWIAPPGNATQVALGLGEAEDAGAPSGANNLNKAEIVYFMSELFRRLFAADVRNEFKAIYEDGNTVIAEHRLSATLAHGREYTNDYCFIFEFDDGQIVEIREYMDTRGGWVQMWGDQDPRKIA